MTKLQIRILVGVSILILVIWFFYGVMLPYIFDNKFEKSGQFGDSFGAINALFSGFGLLAITTTIVLQLEALNKQRNQERFNLLIKLVDDARHDLFNISIMGIKGQEGINNLVTQVKRQFSWVNGGNFDHSFGYLFSVVTELRMLIKLIKKSPELELVEKKILYNKVVLIYSSFLEALFIEMNKHKSGFKSVKCIEFHEAAHDLSTEIDSYFREIRDL